MARAYIGLGANIGDPPAQIRAAFEALDRIAGARLVRRSSLYRSEPVGFTDQPEFVNAVAEIETTLAPRALLNALLAIERSLGRSRSFANAPRTLDLDLLLYADAVVDEPGLRLPHPRMHERAFVLAPLAEMAPDAAIPGLGAIAPLLDACAGQGIEKIPA
jgi:2-amino-4-hydroxy-6-hydroxymethyldihydropteridine diphosphokinase